MAPITATRKKAGPQRRSRTVTRRSGANAEPGWKRLVHLLEKGQRGANSYVVLLGLDTFDSPELLQAVERGLPYVSFEHLVANTSLRQDETLVLVDIPLRTLTRRKTEGRFHQDESDRLLRASRVFAHALRLFEGDRDAAKGWLSRPQKALGGLPPVSVARTEVGALEVERLIGRLDHGVFT